MAPCSASIRAFDRLFRASGRASVSSRMPARCSCSRSASREASASIRLAAAGMGASLLQQGLEPVVVLLNKLDIALVLDRLGHLHGLVELLQRLLLLFLRHGLVS